MVEHVRESMFQVLQLFASVLEVEAETNDSSGINGGNGPLSATDTIPIIVDDLLEEFIRDTRHERILSDFSEGGLVHPDTFTGEFAQKILGAIDKSFSVFTLEDVAHVVTEVRHPGTLGVRDDVEFHLRPFDWGREAFAWASVGQEEYARVSSVWNTHQKPDSSS